MLSDIPTNNEYMLKVAGSSKSIFSQSYYDGEFSEAVEFILEGKLEKISEAQIKKYTGDNFWHLLLNTPSTQTQDG